MRILIISILLSMTIGCGKHNSFKNIKNDLLYSDNNGNLYLKGHIDIASEKYPQNDKIVFLDNVLYKDKVLKLKQFVDTTSFHRINVKKDDDVFVRAIYEDKKYKYIFRDHPTSYPNIWVLDK